MESLGISAPKMEWESSNLKEAWKRFRQVTELMFSGPLKSKSEQEKCSYLLLWVGEKGRDIYNTWTLSEDESKKLKTYYDKYESYVKPKTNSLFCRYKLENRKQGPSEPLDQYITDLKLLVKDCGYPNNDEMVRDRIVFGIHITKLRDKLIDIGDELTLEKAIEMSRTYEETQEQLKSFTANGEDPTVHAVSHNETLKNMSANYEDPAVYTVRQQQPPRPEQRYVPSQPNSTFKQYDKRCGKCGYRHSRTDVCPAQGRRCDLCSKFNHFAAVCRSQGKKVNSIDQNSTDISEREFYVDTVQTNENTDQAYVNIVVASTPIEFKIDTGSQVNIIPFKSYFKMKHRPHIKRSHTHLSSYGGTSLKVRGMCDLPCKYKDCDTHLEFYIVDTDSPAILGLRACIDLQLIQLIMSVDKQECINVEQEYADIFQGIGCFEGECKIHIDPNITPVVNAPRRVPVALRDKLKQKLSHMQDIGVIKQVTKPTPWVNSIVIVDKPKSNDLRICLDPRNLNRAIKRPHYPMQTFEDITTKLAGARYFSKLDARSGYWAIKLSEESSYLTTFSTIFGRFRFLRLPFGIISAQDEFQRKIDETFEGLNGVTGIVDDIVVYGKTLADHDLNLKAVLQRAREKGVRFNPDKCIFRTSEIPFFGHVLTAEGIKPDPSKVIAIRSMKPPQSKKELETFLGMVNYLAKFAPNLSDMTAPLRQLLKGDSEFIWDATHDAAFENVKGIITADPAQILAYYDPAKELTLQVDASQSGLGATIMQHGKPIAYASKSLSQTEQQYAQIEKELYAILYGYKRFHQFIYGRKVTVESDHKPLETILKKPIANAPPRLQRMMLQLQKYDLHIVHVPGKEIPIADSLSRIYTVNSNNCNDISVDLDMVVHSIMNNVPVSPNKLAEIKKESLSDPNLQTVSHFIKNGWPSNRKACPTHIHEFWNFRDKLSVMDDIVFKGEKIVIPKSMQNEMLSLIHLGHMGMEKCKHRARDVLFWPCMCKQIEQLVRQCDKCQERRMANTKEPMVPHDIPSRPWQILSSDVFTWEGNDYIVLTDYYSRYFEVQKLSNTSSAVIIECLKNIFSRHGIPEKLVSDNASYYTSNEFSQFASSWSFSHCTSSPYYAQSNGLAEKTVHTAKDILAKAKDPHLALLEYRNTPINNIASPAQLLMSRRLRSVIPCTDQQLQPKIVNPVTMKYAIEKKQERQKYYYDKTARPLTPMIIGESIRMRHQHGKWIPATVVGIAEQPRSYVVETSDGGRYRRNRRDLLKAYSQYDQINNKHPHETTGQASTNPVMCQHGKVDQATTTVSDTEATAGNINSQC